MICFLLGEMMRLGGAQHEEITKALVKENQALIALVEDEDLLQELEARLRQSESLENFTNHFLGLMERIMTSGEIIDLFGDSRCTRVNHTLLAIINELGVLF